MHSVSSSKNHQDSLIRASDHRQIKREERERDIRATWAPAKRPQCWGQRVSAVVHCRHKPHKERSQPSLKHQLNTPPVAQQRPIERSRSFNCASEITSETRKTIVTLGISTLGSFGTRLWAPYAATYSTVCLLSLDGVAEVAY